MSEANDRSWAGNRQMLRPTAAIQIEEN